MTHLIDYDGREYLILKARGRLRHSKLLSEVIKRGDLLLADVITGSVIIKKRDKENLFIHRHRGDTFLRVTLNEEHAYWMLSKELQKGFMTSYLVRKKPGEKAMRIYAADIIRSSAGVKKAIKEIVCD